MIFGFTTGRICGGDRLYSVNGAILGWPRGSRPDVCRGRPVTGMNPVFDEFFDEGRRVSAKFPRFQRGVGEWAYDRTCVCVRPVVFQRSRVGPVGSCEATGRVV